MKQNLYIFSNSILRRKENTILIETSVNTEPSHQADIDDLSEEVLLSNTGENTETNKKFIPAENVEAIYTFGEVKFNSRFLGFVSKHSIPVHVFNYYGKYTGSFLPKADISSGIIALHQSEHYNNEKKRLSISKSFVTGAAENSVSNLEYYLYRKAPLKEDIESLKNLTYCINSANSVGELMGIEGGIKLLYYSCWKKIFKQDVDFSKRVKRPPDNMINSLISFGNTILYSVCLNEIYRTGLLPSIGFLHSPGDNRFPLSFDIAEVFKPVIVDKTIFKVINLDMISEDGFYRKNDLFYMKENVKRTYIEEIENRLKTTILHPDLKRNVTYKTLIRIECYNLINHLKGKHLYKPFISES